MNAYKKYNMSGLILPLFMISLVLFSSVQLYIYFESSKSINSFGNYVSHLLTSADQYDNFAGYQSSENQCQVFGQEQTCFFPDNHHGASINYENIAAAINNTKNCNYTQNAFSTLPQLSENSLSSNYYCKDVNYLNRSLSIKGNLVQPVQPLVLESGHLLTLFLTGYISSTLVLNTNMVTILALGDVILPNIICQSSITCRLKIYSATGQIIINNMTGTFSLEARAKHAVILPEGYSYNSWQLEDLPKVENLPIAVRAKEYT